MSTGIFHQIRWRILHNNGILNNDVTDKFMGKELQKEHKVFCIYSV